MCLSVPPVALQESRGRWDSKGDTHQEAQQEEEDKAQQGKQADEDDGPELKLCKGEKKKGHVRFRDCSMWDYEREISPWQSSEVLNTL